MNSFLPVAFVAVQVSFMPSVQATTVHVPADQPTIAAGLAAASAGDSVVIACGTYLEHDLVIRSGVTLISSTGLPDCVVIDAGGLGRVLNAAGTSPQTTIEGLTLTRGVATFAAGVRCSATTARFVDCDISDNSASVGGGVGCEEDDTPTFERCRFLRNTATAAGGGLFMEDSNAPPSFVDCVFDGNSGGPLGGALYWEGNGAGLSIVRSEFRRNVATEGGALCSRPGGSSPDSVEVVDCVFVENEAVSAGGAIFAEDSRADVLCTGTVFHGNRAPQGAAVRGTNLASIRFEGCTLALNEASTGRGAIDSGSGTVSLDRVILYGTSPGVGVSGCQPWLLTVNCVDTFGNADGDWAGCLAGLEGVNGNFSADPLFCDAGVGDFTLHANSPCAPGMTACGLVGALPVGCSATAIQSISWGRLKSRFGNWSSR